MATIKPKIGRKKKLSLRKETQIIRKFKEKEFLFASDAKKWVNLNFNIIVSDETIRKTLKTHGLECFKKQRRPSLTPRHIKARLNFAKGKRKLTYTDFKKFLYSDESKFNLSGSDGT